MRAQRNRWDIGYHYRSEPIDLLKLSIKEVSQTALPFPPSVKKTRLLRARAASKIDRRDMDLVAGYGERHGTAETV